jgi:hypothetical protein
MKKLVFASLILCILASGCAGRFEYRPPNSIAPQKNSIEINKSKNEVWKIIVPAIGKNFFVINNLDKESGIINISYSGDPEKYVDCGYIESYEKNAQGERTYYFPAASANQSYEIMDMKHSGSLFIINRKMNLEGRMNLIMEEIAPNKTIVTANTKYVLTKSGTVRNVQGASKSFYDTISFNTNQGARFPGSGSHSGTFCQANGNFEKEVLSLLLNEK